MVQLNGPLTCLRPMGHYLGKGHHNRRHISYYNTINRPCPSVKRVSTSINRRTMSNGSNKLNTLGYAQYLLWYLQADCYTLFCYGFIITSSCVDMIILPLFSHYSDVIKDVMVSQVTNLTIEYPTVYIGTDQRKYQSSASLAFVSEIHWWPVNSPQKWPVTRKMFPFDDVIMSVARQTLEQSYEYCTSAS